jgi:hypothetical protein
MLRLFEDIHRPAGDSKKIVDETPINNAYIAGKLDWADYTHLRKESDDSRTSDGQKLGEKRTEMIKAVTGAIDKSNMLLGKIDPTGGLMLYQFKDFMDKEIERTRAKNEDVMQLFNPDPSNRHYLARPETLRAFQKTWNESLNYFTEQMNRSKGIQTPQGSAHPEDVRKEGEDAESYLQRFRDWTKK